MFSSGYTNSDAMWVQASMSHAQQHLVPESNRKIPQKFKAVSQSSEGKPMHFKIGKHI